MTYVQAVPFWLGLLIFMIMLTSPEGRTNMDNRKSWHLKCLFLEGVWDVLSNASVLISHSTVRSFFIQKDICREGSRKRERNNTKGGNKDTALINLL